MSPGQSQLIIDQKVRVVESDETLPAPTNFNQGKSRETELNSSNGLLQAKGLRKGLLMTSTKINVENNASKGSPYDFDED